MKTCEQLEGEYKSNLSFIMSPGVYFVTFIYTIFCCSFNYIAKINSAICQVKSTLASLTDRTHGHQENQAPNKSRRIKENKHHAKKRMVNVCVSGLIPTYSIL